MNWSNLGNKENNWNIDHKIPISWFKKETPFWIVNHLLNLQPIWRKNNIEKGNIYCHEVINSYFGICKNYIKEEKINLINDKII